MVSARQTRVAPKAAWIFIFLLLGAGFMLLEAQIVSRMALLFGTTWVVNSIVISGLLCLIVAANVVYQRFPQVPLPWTYAGLFLSLIVSFAVPLQRLFFESMIARGSGASTIVLCLPVFFAGIIFVSSFRKVNFQGSALGSNISVFRIAGGGVLESLSLWVRTEVADHHRRGDLCGISIPSPQTGSGGLPSVKWTTTGLRVGFRHCLSQFLIHLFVVLPREPCCQKETRCDRSTPFAPRILSPSLHLIPPAQSKSHAPGDGTTTRGGCRRAQRASRGC